MNKKTLEALLTDSAKTTGFYIDSKGTENVNQTFLLCIPAEIWISSKQNEVEVAYNTAVNSSARVLPIEGGYVGATRYSIELVGFGSEFEKPIRAFFAEVENILNQK